MLEALLKTLLLFIIPANIFLLFLLKNDFHKKIGNQLILLVAYGSGPLLNGLLFYYLILFFPKRDDLFYIVSIFLVWIVFLIYSRKKSSSVVLLYTHVFNFLKKNFTKLNFVLCFIVFLFTILFSIQALAYPISEGDSAYYFLQSSALSQSNNARWYENGTILLHNSDQYNFNPMIRPGIPATNAFSFMFLQDNQYYFAFSFFYVYYYYLLLGLFLFVVGRIALKLNKNLKISQFFAFLFLVFYWNMTRFYIFDNKEVAIFFLAMAGIYLAYSLVLSRKRDIKMEILLGLILGLNAFINLHGIIIDVFILIILFLFSKLSFKQRIYQVLFVFLVHLFFSAFEFVSTFGIIFWNTIANTFHSSGNSGGELVDSKKSAELAGVQIQVTDWKDVYLKGKLQIITNPGSYGFYSLFFILVLLARFKEIFTSTLGKMLLFFIAIYYIVVIDPFNLNKNDLAATLWGGPKYSMTIVLFLLIFIAVYFENIIENIFNFICKKSLFFLEVFVLCLLVFIIFKKYILDFGLKILTNIIQISRDINFYFDKVEFFYYILSGILIFLCLFMLLLYFKAIKKSIAYKIFLMVCSIFMISPFFVAEPGKVPLMKTFSYLREDNEIKLKNTIYFGDLFKVYYFAKDNLPRATSVRTNYLEIFPSNDYLSLKGGGDLESKYEITTNECVSNDYMYSSGTYYLCLVE